MHPAPLPTRFRHLLLATGAELSAEPALAVARAWAARLGARLTTLAVRRAVVQSDARSPPGRRGVTGTGHATAVREGIPAIETVRFAESVMADLIVMVHPQDWEGDRTPVVEYHDAVVRRAEVPCLILPPGQAGLGRIRVALDGSVRGMRALRVAWPLRKLSQGGLSVVHVTGGSQSPREAPVPMPGTTALQVARWIEELVKPDPPPPLVCRRGDLVSEVLAGLSDATADLLVLGVLRGGSAETETSTGGGRAILAAARCAVLTVPV